MKRFLLFMGDYYYPSGGAEDFVGDYDSFEGIKNYIMSLEKPQYWDVWFNTLDLSNGDIIVGTVHKNPEKRLQYFDEIYG